MYNCKLHASETFEFLRFVTYRHADMHRLHPQYLIVALFVVKHRAREVVKYILCRQRAIRLESSVWARPNMMRLPYD